MAITVFAIARIRNLYAVVMLGSIYSLLAAAMFVVLDLVVMFGCRLDVFWGGMVNSGSSRFGKAALLTCAVYSLLSHI